MNGVPSHHDAGSPASPARTQDFDAWAKEMGITQMITATLGGPKNPTMDDVKKAADEYNKIAAVAAKAGIQQGLHNEGFEVSMASNPVTFVGEEIVAMISFDQNRANLDPVKTVQAEPDPRLGQRAARQEKKHGEGEPGEARPPV